MLNFDKGSNPDYQDWRTQDFTCQLCVLPLKAAYTILLSTTPCVLCEKLCVLCGNNKIKHRQTKLKIKIMAFMTLNISLTPM